MWRCAFFATWMLIVLPASAQLRDVGLVNLVFGEVRFAPVSGASTPVKPFMRVREGDRFNLPPGTQLRVVFFEGARQERWTGPASFRAARAHAEAISGAATEIVQLPASAPQRIARIPDLMQNARLGGIRVRGAGRSPAASAAPAESLAEARATYQQMKQALPADDITPELYYYAALEEHAKYDEMAVVVAEMQRKQPGSDDVQALADWVKKKTGN
jgi:hypothetical protein